MYQRLRYLLALAILLALCAALLPGCAADPQARAAPGAAGDVLPTPPPMPTSAPQLPTATPPPAPNMGVAPASAALLRDDFDRAGLAGWITVDAADTGTKPSIWQATGGRVGPLSDGDGMPGLYATALVTGEPKWRDYAVSAAAYADGNDEMGVVARAGEQGYYVFRLLPDGNTTSRVLARYDAETQQFTTIASASGPGFAPGRWYQLMLRVHGDQLVALVDGQEALQATDAVLAQGRAGLYGYAQGGLMFDQFVVEAVR